MPTVYRVEELALQSGVVLNDVPVAFSTFGNLNAAGTNAVLVCHALTGSPEVNGWWGDILGPGKALDTDRFFVVCANTLGSPYGSASPLTTDPTTGKRYGYSFPDVTIRDTVQAHRLLLEKLGVTSVEFAIGGSMGGMQVLEWAFAGDLVKRLVPIAVGGRHSAWCIGWDETQRQAIKRDPLWNNGNYTPGESPDHGLATARMIAMISYRSHEEFHDRFGRSESRFEAASFAVESYLRHHGSKLVGRFDANCYLKLTEQMDTHDVSRGRGDYESVLGSIKQPTLVLGVTSDVLYPLREQEELARLIPNAELEILDAPYGHDSFLINQEWLNTTVRAFTDRESLLDDSVAA